MDNPEAAYRLLQQFDATLHAIERDSIWVFDALDDTADDAATFYRLVEGLCQLALELRSFRHLRAKVFLRTDQFEDRRVGRFPDASKLRVLTASLRWLTTELYGLLWQLLGNHPLRGAEYRQDFYATLFEHKLKGRGLGKEEKQEDPQARAGPDWGASAGVAVRAGHEGAGSFTGSPDPSWARARARGSRIGGCPHIWRTPTEISARAASSLLVDGGGDTADHHADHEFAVHFRSLHAGVHEASRIRVGESPSIPGSNR